MAPCRTCGSQLTKRVGPPKGVVGAWSLRWPQGSLQPFPSEAAARAYMERHPEVGFQLEPPEPADENP